MAYNDGWRVYKNTEIQTECRVILMIAKTAIEKDLRVQQAIVKAVTEKAKEMPLNVSQRVKSKSIGRLQNECE